MVITTRRPTIGPMSLPHTEQWQYLVISIDEPKTSAVLVDMKDGRAIRQWEDDTGEVISIITFIPTYDRWLTVYFTKDQTKRYIQVCNMCSSP